jgi:hypothetical protein
MKKLRKAERLALLCRLSGHEWGYDGQAQFGLCWRCGQRTGKALELSQKWNHALISHRTRPSTHRSQRRHGSAVRRTR